MDHINCCNRLSRDSWKRETVPRNFSQRWMFLSSLTCSKQFGDHIELDSFAILVKLKLLTSTVFLFLSVFYIVRIGVGKIIPVPLPVLKAYNCCNYKLVSLSPPPPQCHLQPPSPQEKTSWKPHDFRLILPPPPLAVFTGKWRQIGGKIAR
jgi:hypothetical protein